MKKFVQLFITILVCFLFLKTNGQQSQLILDYSLPAGDYKARDEVKAIDATDAIPIGTDQIHLFIDKSIQLDATYQSVSSTGIPPITRNLDFTLPVGSSPSSYQVTPNGSLAYSVPIALPPGTQNMAPSLFVEYNSSAGAGMLGYGWNLSGLSAISRAGQSIFHNNAVNGISLTNDDWFTMGGARLIPVTGNNGEDNTVYKTESESFSRITSYGTVGNGPTWFKVETKQGITLELGNSSEARLIPVGNTTVVNWMITKQYDSYGNYVLFDYTNDNGEVLIKEIKYTGNVKASIQPYNSIKFYYDKKTDENTIYTNGSSINSTTLLRNIDITCEGKNFKQYYFKYAFYNVFSFLTEIEEYGGDYKKLNSLAFSYGEDSGSPSLATTNLILSTGTFDCSCSIVKYIPVDFNQDGLKDLVAFNGDLALGGGSIMNWLNWSVFENVGSGQFSRVSSANDFPPDFLPSDFFPNNKNIAGNMIYETTDVDGDCKEDLMFTAIQSPTPQISTGTIDFYPYVSNGTDNFTEPANSVQTNVHQFQGVDYTVRYLDFNGDKKMDIFTYYWVDSVTTSHAKAWIDPLGNTTPVDITSNAMFDFDNAFPADINGDGKTELVNIHLATATNQFAAGTYNFEYTTTGFAFIQDVSGTNYYTSLFDANGCLYSAAYALYGDYNGDGKTDYLLGVPDNYQPVCNWQLNYGKGDGSFHSLPLTTPNLGNPLNNCSLYYYARDVNSDGKTDILEFERYTNHTDLSNSF